jgi:hypothetical protein
MLDYYPINKYNSKKGAYNVPIGSYLVILCRYKHIIKIREHLYNSAL